MGAFGAPWAQVLVLEAGGRGSELAGRASDMGQRSVWMVKTGASAFGLMAIMAELTVDKESGAWAWVVELDGANLPESAVAVSRACGVRHGVAVTWSQGPMAQKRRLEKGEEGLMARLGPGATEPSLRDRIMGELDRLVEAGEAAGAARLPLREDGCFFETDTAESCLALLERHELGGAAGGGDGPGLALALRL